MVFFMAGCTISGFFYFVCAWCLLDLGGCFHMSWTTLGTSCVPKDGHHNLRGFQSVGGCSPGCFWMFFFIKISGFFYIFVCCWLGLGGCSHMFGIALVTGCSPKDSLHHLVGPSLLVNVPLAGFGGPFYCNILGFLYFVCVAGWDWGVLP